MSEPVTEPVTGPVTEPATAAVTDPAPAADLAALFAATGVPPGQVGRVSARLGPGAADLLRDDPWRLLLVPGVRPDQADHFARAVLGGQAGPDDPRRGRALVSWLLANAAREGHTATPAADVVAALARLRVADPARAVGEVLDEAVIMAFTDEPALDDGGDADGDLDEPPEPETVLGLARPALAEEALAEGVMRLSALAEPFGVPEGGTGTAGPAAESAWRHGVSVLRVPPGRDAGESIVALAVAGRDLGLRVTVTCPTVRSAAALRSGPLSPGGPDAAGGAGGLRVTTPRRLLEAVEGPDGVAFARGERLPVEADLVIVTEAHTLDVELAAALVEACPDGAHLLLAGDPGGLPPAGPGRVLADLVASGVVPVAGPPPARTAAGDAPDDAPAAPATAAPIAHLTAEAADGRAVTVDAPGREVVIVTARDAGEAVHRAVQLVTDSIPRALGIAAEDVQVVTAAPAGAAGMGALNAALRARLNPGAAATSRPGPAAGDRIVLVEPFGDLAAGETGVVRSAGPDGVVVGLADGDVTVPAAFASRLRPGWAVTVGLAMGDRWPAVVTVFPPGAPLTRPLVCTAFGRAWRHLSIVQAAGPALASAVREGDPPARRTRLAALLRG